MFFYRLRFILCLSLLLFYINFAIARSKKDRVSSCDLCKDLVKTFLDGMQSTENLNYDGGDVNWIRKNLGSYKDSETRFVTIMEDLCRKQNDKPKCRSFLEKNEDLFEQWFMKSRKDGVDLFDFMCVQENEVCCPPFHYGKGCDLCTGYIDGVMCSGHGNCIKEGTRKGNGSCSCEMGYAGELCEKCVIDSYKTEDGSCLPCHKSCSGPCTNHTVEGCLGTCKEGFKVDENGKCEDIDECSLNTHDCKEGQRCLNVPGKFYCRDCHESCLTCNGDEEDKCITCKPGYEKDDQNRCVDIDECLDSTHQCKKMTYCANKPGTYKCKKCHKGCATGCTGPKLSDCIGCENGYTEDENGSGCKDVDECQGDKQLCSEGRYCVNKEGSYKCRRCHEACSICHGPGPYSCYACSSGYKMVKGLCIDSSKVKQTEDAEDEEDL